MAEREEVLQGLLQRAEEGRAEAERASEEARVVVARERAELVSIRRRAEEGEEERRWLVGQVRGGGCGLLGIFAILQTLRFAVFMRVVTAIVVVLLEPRPCQLNPRFIVELRARAGSARRWLSTLGRNVGKTSCDG